MSMINCPACEKEIPEEAKICEFCGKNLERRSTTRDTMITDLSDLVGGSVVSGYGSSSFVGKSVVVIYVKGTAEPVIAHPDGDYVIGRQSGSSSAVHLDLENYEGASLGVSRQHALFRIDEEGQLMLHDLGSKNGTFLNDTPVSPDIPQVLHDGDIIRVGKVILHIYFK